MAYTPYEQINFQNPDWANLDPNRVIRFSNPQDKTTTIGYQRYLPGEPGYGSPYQGGVQQIPGYGVNLRDTNYPYVTPLGTGPYRWGTEEFYRTNPSNYAPGGMFASSQTAMAPSQLPQAPSPTGYGGAGQPPTGGIAAPGQPPNRLFSSSTQPYRDYTSYDTVMPEERQLLYSRLMQPPTGGYGTPGQERSFAPGPGAFGSQGASKIGAGPMGGGAYGPGQAYYPQQGLMNTPPPMGGGWYGGGAGQGGYGGQGAWGQIPQAGQGYGGAGQVPYDYSRANMDLLVRGGAGQGYGAPGQIAGAQKGWGYGGVGQPPTGGYGAPGQGYGAMTGYRPNQAPSPAGYGGAGYQPQQQQTIQFMTQLFQNPQIMSNLLRMLGGGGGMGYGAQNPFFRF